MTCHEDVAIYLCVPGGGTASNGGTNRARARPFDVRRRGKEGAVQARHHIPIAVAAMASLFATGPVARCDSGSVPDGSAKRSRRSAMEIRAASRSVTGSPRMWEDRGALTPTRVYFAVASERSDPLEALPAPPFDHFEPDDKDRLATSPKATVRDANNVKWTAKFGPEVHSDTVAPRLAWALGYRVVEGYYVGPGRIRGIGPETDRGREKDAIGPDGSFQGGARFKKHDKEFAPLKDEKGSEVYWDEARNPGVPPEQLSGMILFDVLVDNWDAQPKNSKVYLATGNKGAEEWYIESDLGGTFAPKPGHKYVLAEYVRATNFVKRVA